MSLLEASYGADLTGCAAEPTPLSLEQIQTLRDRGLHVSNIIDNAVVVCRLGGAECTVFGGAHPGEVNYIYGIDPEHPQDAVEAPDRPAAVSLVLHHYWDDLQSGRLAAAS